MYLIVKCSCFGIVKVFIFVIVGGRSDGYLVLIVVFYCCFVVQVIQYKVQVDFGGRSQALCFGQQIVSFGSNICGYFFVVGFKVIIQVYNQLVFEVFMEYIFIVSNINNYVFISECVFCNIVYNWCFNYSFVLKFFWNRRLFSFFY